MSLPSLRRRARLGLSLFLAAIVVTWVASFVGPSGERPVCSAHGKQVASFDGSARQDDGSHGPADDHGAHCPLCMPVGAPPTVQFWCASASAPRTMTRRSMPTTTFVTRVGASFPARGPPEAS